MSDQRKDDLEETYAVHMLKGVGIAGGLVLAAIAILTVVNAANSSDESLQAELGESTQSDRDQTAQQVVEDRLAVSVANSIPDDPWARTIETSFGEHVTLAVCEENYWQLNQIGGNDRLVWRDTNGTVEDWSDDFSVSYNYDFDGRTLRLTDGVLETENPQNPKNGQSVSDKTFPMIRGGDGYILNGEQLSACRN